MGSSASADLWYGIYVSEEDYEFPWSEHDSIEAWWRELNGYKPPFKRYSNEEGEPLNDGTPDADQVTKYYAVRREWDERNPIPVKPVNTGINDFRMISIAVPGAVHGGGGDCDATELDLTKLVISPDALDKFNEFVKMYLPDLMENKLAWYLSAYYG